MTKKNLSNIELYYTSPENISDGIIKLTGEECKHAVKVMRNSIGDIIHITNGTGKLFKSKIISIDRAELTAQIVETYSYENKLTNIYFCIPKLKNPDRFKFTLEKCAELGITNFIIFESKRSVAKGTNLTRWEKIILSAMKQSLRAHLPQIQIIKSLIDIIEIPGKKIVFEQNSEKKFRFDITQQTNHYFIFGPEGGLTADELSFFDSESIYSLSDHRLRSETAIVKTASLLN